MFDWDDLRFFLAVARTGTTLRAASKLGFSQPTVVRRISALEGRCGLKLFDRGPTGYSLTDAGRAIVPIAERAEAEMQGVKDAITCWRERGSETIRLTLPDAFDGFLLPLLQSYREAWPQVQVQILSSFRRLDLGRGEADMAVRVGEQPDSDALLVRPMPPAGWTVYAARSYAARAGLPASADDIRCHPIIAGEGPVKTLPSVQWLERAAVGSPIMLRCNSVAALQSAIRAGVGLSILPCIFGERDPDLVRCFPPVRELTVPIWLVTRRELCRLPHVRALFEEISRQLEAHAGLLSGAVAACSPAVVPPILVQPIQR